MIEHGVVLALASRAETALARVAGLPLVKRQILTMGRAGIRHVVVVGSDTVVGTLGDDRDFQAANVRVEAVATAETAETTALELARARVLDAVAVATCDQVFDPDIIKRARAATGSAACVGAAGQRGVYVLAAGTVLPAGQDLATAVTGAGAATVDTGDVFWRRLDSEAARKDAERAMFRALVKRVDGPISRLINRRISLSITKQIINTNITPNQMTVVATIVGLAGVIAVFQATWLSVAVGALLVQMQSVLDGCDGELARLKFKSSRLGEWLDNVLDDQVNVGYGIGLGYAASVLLDQPIWLWFGIGSGAAFLIHNTIFYLQLALVHRSGNPFNFRWWFESGSKDVTAMLDETGVVALAGAFVRSLVRRDVFLFAFFVLAAIRLPQVAVTWYALVAATQFLLMMAHVVMGGPWKWRVPS